MLPCRDVAKYRVSLRGFRGPNSPPPNINFQMDIPTHRVPVDCFPSTEVRREEDRQGKESIGTMALPGTSDTAVSNPC